MASVNRVIVLGNVTKDPEIRYTADGSAICNLTLATNRTWKDKDGQKQEEAEFHRCSFFGRTAEVAGEYVKKGNPLYVEGRLRTRKWQDKDGTDRYTTEIVVETMQLLGSRSGGERSGGDGFETPEPPAQRRPPAQHEDRRAPPRTSPRVPPAFPDDDIPF